MKHTLLHILALLLLFPGVAKSQHYHFEKITEDHGLSDNRVTCFMKDLTGFMWIGTANGLNRYDGHTFRIYRPGQKKYSLSHEHINDVEEDHHGRLWISTWNGLNLLDPKTDSLVIFSPDEEAHRQKKNKLTSALIWDTYVDDTGRVWVAPDSRDLCYYTPTTGEFIQLPWREFIKTVLPGHAPSLYRAIHKITRKSDTELWLGTSVGLFSFNMRTSTFQYYGGDYPEDFVSLYYDSAGEQIFFGQKNLYVYKLGQKAAEKIPLENDQILLSQESPILLATHARLWAIHPRKKKASRVIVNEKESFTIHHEVPNTVFQDHKTLWIGTADGIRKYDAHMDRFHFTTIFPDTLKKLTGNIYHILDRERDRKYYFSSYTGNKLIILDKKSGERNEITAIAGKPLLKCSKTFEDSKQRIWILTERSIFIADPLFEKISVFEFPSKDDPYGFIDMIEDADGNFWFASIRYGVFHFNPRTNTWKLLQEKPDGLWASRPTALLSDPANRSVWIGDYSYGAFHYDIDSGKFTSHGMDANNPDLLHSSLINALALDKNGDVWIATTSGGVSKYTYATKKFTTYMMASGLPENTIHAIQTDNNGNLWLASPQGLTCMTSSGKIIQHYEKNSGLPYTNFSTPLSMNYQGEILTGIANGFVKFHPDSMVIITENFPVIITTALQGDREMELDSSQAFPYHRNEFTFQFAALTYTLPQQVTYFYKLEGYDHDWINAGNNHVARYTNLSEGNYTFYVKAADYTGRTSSSFASLAFKIDPPFWKTWWFIVLVFVVFSSLLYRWIASLQEKIISQQTLNRFATSLYNKNTVEEVFWDISQNCIRLLKFEDCVIYLLLPDRNVLIQKAAAGPKSHAQFKIANPIEIPVGAGIVGTVAQSAVAEIIHDTSKDSRYIIDDQRRHSEITVPIIVDGKVFGVIDSEHSRKNFYKRWHLRMLTGVAAICAAKIGRYFIEDQIRSKVARDLHDDMGSTLSSIKIMSNIALEKKESDATQNYLKSIRQNAAQMQESMGDIVWAINPENDTIERVIIKMKEFAAEILEPLNISYEFREEGEFSLARMDLNTRKDFYLIFKEAINNAAKYSQCEKVIIHLKHSDKETALIIRDNGIGMNNNNTHSGNGLKNMKYRAANIGGQIEIHTKQGEGTTIYLNVPSHDQGI